MRSEFHTLLRCLVVVYIAVALAGCGGSSSSGGDGSSSDNSGSPYTARGSSYGSEATYGTDQAAEYSPYADAQDAWDNQDGPDWEAFGDAYISGWDEGCDIAFEDSPDGYLYDQGDQFSSDDCQLNNPQDAADASDIPVDVPDDPEQAGEDLGQADGCESAFADLPSDGGGELFDGTDYYDDSVCPAA
jgi:hypothetical protein